MSKLQRQYTNLPDFDKLFEMFAPVKNTFYGSAFSPACDVIVDGEFAIIYMDIPGVDEKDISITTENRNIIIKGERKPLAKVDGNDYSRTERLHGKFTRTFSVPDNLDLNNISAEYVRGVLTVKIARAEAAKPRQILIGKGALCPLIIYRIV